MGHFPVSSPTVTPGTVTLTGDANGAANANTVTKIKATAITGNPTKAGEVLTSTGTDAAHWATPAATVTEGTTHYSPVQLAAVTLAQFSATGTALPAVAYTNTAGTLTASAVGVLTIDSVAVTATAIIAVCNQASQFQNGIYKCTTAGTASVHFVLTRLTTANTGAKLGRVLVARIKHGTLWGGGAVIFQPAAFGATFTLGTTHTLGLAVALNNEGTVGSVVSTAGIFATATATTLTLRPNGPASTTHQVTIAANGTVTVTVLAATTVQAKVLATSTGIVTRATSGTLLLRPNATTSAIGELSIGTSGLVSLASGGSFVTSSAATFLSPHTIVSGTAWTPSATKDCLVYFGVTLAGTLTLKIGSHVLYTAFPVVAGSTFSFRVPAAATVTVTLTTATVTTAKMYTC